MCFEVYIGSDKPLPTIGLEETQGRFSVKDLEVREQVVTQHFSKPHVYHVGSYEGCSCGFFDTAWLITKDEEDRKDYEESVASLQAFAAYLDKALEGQDALELFVTWYGHESWEPNQRLTLSPRDLVQPSLEFQLEEQDFVIIQRKKS